MQRSFGRNSRNGRRGSCANRSHQLVSPFRWHGPRPTIWPPSRQAATLQPYAASRWGGTWRAMRAAWHRRKKADGRARVHVGGRYSMAEGNILIRCPGCGKPQSVVMAVGQQLQCGVCQTVFFAPVLASDQLPPTTMSESFSVEPPSTSPALPPGRQAAIGAQVPTPLSETRPIERVAASRSWRTDGRELESPSATVPRFEPQGDTGPGPGSSAAPQEPGKERSGGGKIWTVMTVVAGLIIVAASLLVGIHFVRNWRQVADEPAGNPRPAPAPAASPVRHCAVSLDGCHWACTAAGTAGIEDRARQVRRGAGQGREQRSDHDRR